MAVDAIVTNEPQAARLQQDLQKLRETTDKVVGSVFYGTMLKAMRDSTIKGAYGHGGRGEDVFGAQLHALYAERIGAGQRGGLQDALFASLEKQQRAISAGAEPISEPVLMRVES